ncbi:MAG: hypothetical protein M1536_03805 [Firmicutes bacterium]|nr:hypothetical protein [Bacillota bacterium]
MNLRSSVLKIIIAAFLVAGLSLSLGSLSKASHTQDNNPVAMVAMVSGDAQFQVAESSYKMNHAYCVETGAGQCPVGFNKLYLMQKLAPGDQIKTNSNGKITVIYFYDGHTETIGSDASAKIDFKTLSDVSGSVDRSGMGNQTEIFEVPYFLQGVLTDKALAPADEPGAKENEEMYLKSSANTEVYPPAFSWADTGAKQYKFQLFNEWNEFIYESVITTNSFKYPMDAPLQLTKGGLYYWQVLTMDNQRVVPKTPFKITTAIQANLIKDWETQFENSKKMDPNNTVPYIKMLLLYNNFRMWGKLVRLTEAIRDIDSQNPLPYRTLARLYLVRGCPYFARESLQKAVALGAEDPVIKVPEEIPIQRKDLPQIQ